MPFDGSGNFTRSYNFVNDKNAAIKITASRVDGEFDNFSAAMNQTFMRSGIVPMTGNVNLGTNTITNAGNGLAGSPAFRFNTDTTSGLFMPAAGQVALSAGSVERITANSTGAAINGAITISSNGTVSGNLAVTGTTTLSSTLGVTGASTFTALTTHNGGIQLNGALAATGAGAFTGQLSTLGGLGVGTASPSEKFHVLTAVAAAYGRFQGTTGNLYVGVNGSNDGEVNVSTNNNLVFKTFGSERARIDASGNVSVGTSGTDGRVTVKDAGAGQFAMRNSADVIKAYIGTNSIFGSSAADALRIRGDAGIDLGVAGSIGMSVDTANRVGVGISSGMSNRFTIRSDSTVTNILMLSDSNVSGKNWGVGPSAGTGNVNTFALPYNYTDSKAGSLYTAGASGSWQWYIDGAEKMRIDGNGNVGVGTTAPNNYGAGYSSIHASNTSGGVFRSTGGAVSGDFYADTAGTVNLRSIGTSPLRFLVNSAEALRIDSSGNVGVGTTNPAGYRMRIAGASGTPQWRAGTDATAYWEVNGFDAGGAFLMAAGSTATYAGFGSQTNIPLLLHTNNTEKARIAPNGDFMVGGTAPLESYGRRTLSVYDGTTGGLIELGGPSSGHGALYWDNATTTLLVEGRSTNANVKVIAAGTGAITFNTNGNTRLSIDSFGQISSSDLANAIGYKGIPQNGQAGAYTLIMLDQGRHVYCTGGAASVTIPPNSSVAFPIGTTIPVVNDGSGVRTITQGAGVTLKWAGTGTTGNRSLAVGGLCNLLKVATDTWFVSGAGLS